ncbi:hypothetical protein O3M35_004943 [Rhynocoris fuscipes]|uniref:Lipocalin/cytosolic fatty-acid binding domain-containing protein n=1 Tax=Rhynocoris fuscipes TaxID=488301 RepID=A0AAW1DK48_9HEMI
MGIFALSSAVPVKPECKNLPAKPDFNTKAFFQGTWYLTHGYVPEYPGIIHELNVCLSIKSLLISPILYQFYTVNMASYHQMSYVQGFAILNEGDGKYVTQLRPVTKDGEPDKKFVPMTQTIIDTDYENYAVGYFCVESSEGLMGTNFGVLSRNPNPDKVHPNVEVVLNTLGLKLSDFASTEKMNCQEV